MMKHYLRLALPASLNQVQGLLVMQMNFVFLGRFASSTMVAGVGMGSVTLNVCCLGFMYGLNGAQDTLVSRAFGLNDLRLCGEYLNRGRAIITVIFIPIIILLLFSEKLLLAIG